MVEQKTDNNTPLTDEERKAVIEAAVQEALDEGVTVQGSGYAWNGNRFVTLIDPALSDKDKRALQQEISTLTSRYINSVAHGKTPVPGVDNAANRAQALLTVMQQEQDRQQMHDGESQSIQDSNGTIFLTMVDITPIHPTVNITFPFFTDTTTLENEREFIIALNTAKENYTPEGRAHAFPYLPQMADIRDVFPLDAIDLSTPEGLQRSVSSTIAKVQNNTPLDKQDWQTIFMFHLVAERSAIAADLLGYPDKAKELRSVITASYNGTGNNPAVSLATFQNAISNGILTLTNNGQGFASDYVRLAPDMQDNAARRESTGKEVTLERGMEYHVSTRVSYAGFIEKGQQYISSNNAKGDFKDIKKEQMREVAELAHIIPILSNESQQAFAPETLAQLIEEQREQAQQQAAREASPAQDNAFYNEAGNKMVDKDGNPLKKEDLPRYTSAYKKDENGKLVPVKPKPPVSAPAKPEKEKEIKPEKGFVSVLPETPTSYYKERFGVSLARDINTKNDGSVLEEAAGDSILTFVFNGLTAHSFDSAATAVREGVQALRKKTNKNRVTKSAERQVTGRLTRYWQNESIAFEDIADHFHPNIFAVNSKNIDKTVSRADMFLNKLEPIFINALETQYPGRDAADYKDMASTLVQEINDRAVLLQAKKGGISSPGLSIAFTEEAAHHRESKTALKMTGGLLGNVFKAINTRGNATHSQAVGVFKSYLKEQGSDFDALFSVSTYEKNNKIYVSLSLKPDISLEALIQYNDMLIDERTQPDGVFKKPASLQDKILTTRQANKEAYKEEKAQQKRAASSQKDIGTIDIDTKELELGQYKAEKETPSTSYHHTALAAIEHQPAPSH